MLILVADSEIEHRVKLVNHITRLDHTPIECMASKDILDCCRKEFPDLLFIDYKLSKDSTTELIRKLRALGGHAIWNPIILIGKEVKDNAILAAIEVGADDYLEKPIPTVKIVAKVSSALRNQKLKEDVFTVAHDLVLANRAMEGLVTQDVMTGVANSNSFEENLEKEWFTAKKNTYPLALIMLDIDYFNKYNETYGAAMGDDLIKKIADCLKQNLPGKKDFLARTTGGTFAVILPNLDNKQSLIIANKFCQEVTNLNIAHIGSGCTDHATISAGVSNTGVSKYTNPWDLVEAAEFALYKAKHAGRNKVSTEEIVYK